MRVRGSRLLPSPSHAVAVRRSGIRARDRGEPDVATLAQGSQTGRRTAGWSPSSPRSWSAPTTIERLECAIDAWSRSPARGVPGRSRSRSGRSERIRPTASDGRTSAGAELNKHPWSRTSRSIQRGPEHDGARRRSPSLRRSNRSRDEQWTRLDCIGRPTRVLTQRDARTGDHRAEARHLRHRGPRTMEPQPWTPVRRPPSWTQLDRFGAATLEQLIAGRSSHAGSPARMLERGAARRTALSGA